MPESLTLRYSVAPAPNTLCKVWLGLTSASDEPRPVNWQRTFVEYADGTNATEWRWFEAGDPVFVRAGGASTEPLPTVYGVHAWDLNRTVGVLSLQRAVSFFEVTWVVSIVSNNRLNGAPLETGIDCGDQAAWTVAAGRDASIWGAAAWDLAVAAPGAVSLAQGHQVASFGGSMGLAVFSWGGDGELTLQGAVDASVAFAASQPAVHEWHGDGGEVRASLDWRGTGLDHGILLVCYGLHPIDALASLAAALDVRGDA